MTFLLVFIALSIVNVIFGTIKSIATIKSGKVVASTINGLYYAFYNIVLIYTVAEFPLWQKCIITFLCNLIGVFVVKLVEEKIRKEQLWKIECTMPKEEFEREKIILDNIKVPHNYIDIDKYYLVNFYCSTRRQSETIKYFLQDLNVKYFVSESKSL